METVGYATLQVIPSVKGAEKSIASQMGSPMAAAGKSSGSKFGGGFGAALGGVTKVAVGTVAAVGGILGGLAIKGGISRQLQIEDATAKLVGLKMSTADVKATMDSALASVKGTAFGMGEAATVAAGATAAGIKPGQDLTRILKLTADSATIAGSSMGEMGGIFNKVASSGKLTGDVVAQLQDRGFPILSMLGEKLGKSTSEISKMVSSGKISFKDFADSIEENVGGAALKSGNTTTGAFKNMKSALSRIGVTLTSAFFPLVKDGLNQMTTLFDGVNEKIKPVADSFAKWFQGKAGPIIAGFASGALASFDKIYAGLQMVLAPGTDIGAEMASKFSPRTLATLEFFGDQLSRITTWIKESWALFSLGWSMPPSLAAAFNPADIQTATAWGIGLQGVVSRVKDYAIQFGDGIKALVTAAQEGGDEITSSGFAGALEQVGLWLNQAWVSFAPAAEAIKTSWNTLMQSLSTGDFSGVGGALASVFGSIGPIIQPMGVVLAAVGSNIGAVATELGNLLAGALPLLAPIIQSLADGFVWLGQHSELIPPILIAVGGALLVFKTAQAAANMAELFALPIKAAGVVANFALARANNTLASATLQAAGAERLSMVARLPAVGQVLVHTAAIVGHRIAMAASAVWMGIVTAAQWAWNLAMNANPIALIVIAIAALVAGLIWVATQTTFFQDVWAAVWSFVTMAFTAFVVWISAAFNGLVAWWSSVWNTVATVVPVFWGMIVTFVQVYIGMVLAIVGAIGAGIAATWNGIWSGIAGFFSGVWAGIVAGVSGAFGFVRSIVSSGLSAVFGFVSSILSNIGSFFSSTWANVIGGVSGFIGNFMGFFTSLPGKVQGALAGAGSWLVSAGKNIINGLISGVQSMMGAIGNAILSLVPGPIVGVFKTALGIASPSKVFMALGKFIPQGLAKGIRGAVGVVKDSIGALTKATAMEPLEAKVSSAVNIGRLTADDLGFGGDNPGPSLPPIYIQSPVSGEYLRAHIDSRVDAGVEDANKDFGRRRPGVRA